MLHLPLGTMLSLQLLVVFVGSAAAARDATIFVESTVVVIKPLSEVTLPCSYTTDEPDAPVIIRWERGHRDGPVVLLKSSIGKISAGAGYETIAELGENCSLILKNPEPELSGTYTVTVDVHNEVSRDVQLFVFNETITLRMNSTGEYRSNGDVTCVTYKTDEERVNWLVLAVIILASIVILSLGVCLFRLCNILRLRRNRKTPEEENDDRNGVLHPLNDENRPPEVSLMLKHVHHTPRGKSLDRESRIRSRSAPLLDQTTRKSLDSGIKTDFSNSSLDSFSTVEGSIC